MTNYRIRQQSQSVQVLQVTGSGAVAARLINTPRGWFAHKGASGSDENAPNVSHLINQHGGGNMIAGLLGFEQ